MLALRITLLSILALHFTLNLNSQDISIDVFVHNHHTYAPLDSALVKALREGAILTSSYTGIDGRTQLIITPTGVEERRSGIPHTFTVSENYPNPFRDNTQVDFSIPESRTVRADVYNIIGQRVLSEELPLSAGYYTMNLSLPHLPTGIYFLRFRGKEQQAIKLMKVGGDVHYDTGLPSRGSIQVTARGGIDLPLRKTAEENGEFTIQVEKDRYELWSVKKQIESDTEINVPLVLLAEHLLTDIDGNTYQTVKIGNQLWMSENLRVTRYNNGDEIPSDLDITEWHNATSGAYAIYPHDNIDGINSEEEMVNTYGKLYNWYALDDDRGLCPEGWRVPGDDHWKQLEMHLGITEEQADSIGWRGTEEGGKLKSTRTEPDQHPRWNSPNTAATNESKFSGLPGGFRRIDGNYRYFGIIGGWWSSTQISTILVAPATRSLAYNSSTVSRGNYNKQGGFSVRCIRD